MTDLLFLIPDVIAQISYPIVEVAMIVETPTKEVKTKVEKHPVTAEAKISKCSV